MTVETMATLFGFILGCFVLLAALLGLVFRFAPFTPAVLAIPILLLLSEVVALAAVDNECAPLFGHFALQCHDDGVSSHR